MSGARRAAARWLSSTSNRSFVLWPIVLLAAEAAIQRGLPRIQLWALPLLAWGYLQYRLIGNYRSREGGGGPGLSIPPERLVTGGPYRYCRNPMYLGHLIFLLGLTLTFSSPLAFGCLAFSAIWFHSRVLRDENRLRGRFGEEYEAYARRVKRWIPGLF